MKIRSKKIIKCEYKGTDDVDVLEIKYTHMGMEWKIIIRDYDPALEKETIKALRKEVREQYLLTKKKWQ